MLASQAKAQQNRQPIQQLAGKLLGKLSFCDKLKVQPNLLKSLTSSTREKLDKLLSGGGGANKKTREEENATSKSAFRLARNFGGGSQRGGGQVRGLFGGATLRRSLSFGSANAPTFRASCRRRNQSTRANNRLLAAAAAASNNNRRRQQAAAPRLLGALGLVQVVLVLLCSLGVQLAANGAPLSQRAIEPIWLSGGLLTVGAPLAAPSSGAAEDSAAASAGDDEADEAAQHFEEQRRLEQETEGAARARQIESILSEALQEASRSQALAQQPQQQQQQPDELVLLERRRLDRNRALEPPAWSRERPIRRDGRWQLEEPVAEQQVDAPPQQPPNPSNEPYQQRLPRGGAGSPDEARTYLADELYAELLRYLVEGALGLGDAIGSAGQSSLDARPAIGAGAQQEQQSADELLSGNDQTPDSSGADDELVLFPPTTGGAQLDGPQQQLAAADGTQSAALMQQPLEQQPQLEFSPVGPDSAPDDDLLALRQAAGGQMSSAQDGDQFHVLEDIDQVDGTQPQLSGPAGGWLRRPEQFAQQLVEQTSGGDLSDEVGRDETLVASRVRRYTGSSAAGWSQEQPLRRAAATSRNQILDLAAKLIRLRRFSRQQLLLLGRRLKIYLEQAIGLAPNRIVGLYPVEPNKLLVELDQQKLAPAERAYLAGRYNYLGGRLLGASWPKSSRENPVPLLAAIIDNLVSLLVRPVGRAQTRVCVTKARNRSRARWRLQRQWVGRRLMSVRAKRSH